MSMLGRTALELDSPCLRIIALTTEQFGLLLESPARLALAMGFAAPGAAWDTPALEAMQTCTGGPVRTRTPTPGMPTGR